MTLSAENAIKTMKLYSNIDRIEKELEEMGCSHSSALTQEALSPFDSMHYDGDKAVQAALDMAASANSEVTTFQNYKILDVGSGFGGPARYMASKGHKVVALELQKDVHAKGAELTQRCDLSSSVTHVHGDILESGSEEWRRAQQYDLLTSWLVFLHIDNKSLLLERCASSVKSGGAIFIEDFYKRMEFSPEEDAILSRDIYCQGSTLHTKEQYIACLEKAGFKNILFLDKTLDWRAFVAKRLEGFIAAKERFVSIHGIEAYTSLHHFYNAMDVLFQGSSLGGVRLFATKS